MIKKIFSALLLSFLVCTQAHALACVEMDTDRDLDVNATGQLTKGSLALLCGYHFHNKSASTVYLKFYNKATAGTVGTDTPKMTIPIPAGAAGNIAWSGGILFPLGLSFGATTAYADNSTAAPAAQDLIIDVVYK